MQAFRLVCYCLRMRPNTSIFLTHYTSRIDARAGWVSLSSLPKDNFFTAYLASYKGFKDRFVMICVLGGATFTIDGSQCLCIGKNQWAIKKGSKGDLRPMSEATQPVDQETSQPTPVLTQPTLVGVVTKGKRGCLERETPQYQSKGHIVPSAKGDPELRVTPSPSTSTAYFSQGQALGLRPTGLAAKFKEVIKREDVQKVEIEKLCKEVEALKFEVESLKCHVALGLKEIETLKCENFEVRKTSDELLKDLSVSYTQIMKSKATLVQEKKKTVALEEDLRLVERKAIMAELDTTTA
ncbi:hypothetical protein CR513_47354, partial [Mucuna pruriens]